MYINYFRALVPQQYNCCGHDFSLLFFKFFLLQVQKTRQKHKTIETMLKLIIFFRVQVNGPWHSIFFNTSILYWSWKNPFGYVMYFFYIKFITHNKKTIKSIAYFIFLKCFTPKCHNIWDACPRILEKDLIPL